MILLSTLVTSLQKELGSFNSTEQHPDMYRYINSAINYIFNYRDWEWNRYTYALSYTTPSVEVWLSVYPYKVFYVKSGNNILTLLNKEEWFILDDHSNSVSCIQGGFISDTAWDYTILYSKTAPIVSALDVSIDMPDYYKDVLQAIAVHYAFKDIKDYSSASALIGQANAILNSATERSVDVLPRNTVRLWANYSF